VIRGMRLQMRATSAWLPLTSLLVACEGGQAQDANASIEVGPSDLPREVPSSLTGTSWRLIGYDSYESGSERGKPAPGETHKITFEPGGRLVVQLACNRGVGGWKASQREPDRGGLEISPLDISRTRCAGAGMERIQDDLEYVGSYVIKADGELVLNLRADSGNLIWKRAK